MDRRVVLRLGILSDETVDMSLINVDTHDAYVCPTTLSARFVILSVNHTHSLRNSVHKQRAEQDGGDSIDDDSSFLSAAFGDYVSSQSQNSVVISFGLKSAWHYQGTPSERRRQKIR